MLAVAAIPEGTRSRSGEMGDFKTGAFRLAIDAQVPILPLAVFGARDALRSHDWRLDYARAEVRVLEPVSTVGLTNQEVPELLAKVREMIVVARADLQRELAG